jgi:hypothetical protein
MKERSLPRILARLAALQASRPVVLLLAALLSLIPAGAFALKLGFKPDFAELLPDNKDSVIELRRISTRLPGIATLTVTAEIEDGKNSQALVKFVDDLVPRLSALGPAWVGAVDYGTQHTRAFFDKHKLLFAKLDDLQKTHDELVERYEYEIAKRRGDLLDDSDPPPPITAEQMKKRLTGGGGETPAGGKAAPADLDQSSSGYYLSKDGRFIAVLVRTSVSGKADREALKQKVSEAVAAVEPQKLDPTMKIGYTGDLIISAEAYDAIVRDLGEVGVVGVAGVLASVLLFFLRVRIVAVMGLSLLAGLLWTFGITYFTIGYLNSSTGFLVSIIAGNGINYGIMYMARYIEARRDDKLPVAEAIRVAHRDTWIPTLSSSATGMLAYGSLMATDFRGFKHFGIIGSYGMILCWVTTYLFTPALLAASERLLPLFNARAREAKPSRWRGYYGFGFSWLAHAAPRSVAIAGTVIGLASLGVAYRYIASDPMEYNMRNIDNDGDADKRGKSAAMILSLRVGKIVGRMGQDGMAIMTERLDQVPMLATALQKRHDAAPPDLKPFEKVVTIYSLLPEDQEQKIPLVQEMRRILLKARTRGVIADTDWSEIEPYLPQGDVRPIGIADLPEQAARAFTERDGTRGKIVYIVPKTGFSVWDAKYLMRWADSFRYTELPTGEVIKGSGRAVLYADMIKTVAEDAPKAIAISALGSILVILLAFRGHRHAWGVFLPWLMGLSLLLAFLHWRGIKLNFLNFVTIPITVGIGAEYAHNLMQRYRSEGGQRLQRVITETGGAIVLCSMTTVIGYVALMGSINKGIVSFGLAAATGELVCLLAAVLVLPAFWVWHQRRTEAAARSPAVPEELPVTKTGSEG